MAKKLKATTAGSLPKYEWLAETETLWPKWKVSENELWEKQKESAMLWIEEQEKSGLEIISEGEQFRIHFVHGFLERIKGIDWNKKTKMGIRNDRYTVEVPTVVDVVRREESIHSKEAQILREHTKQLTKFTLPGPMTIADTIANDFYSSKQDMAMHFAQLLNTEANELSQAGIDIIQFDEPAFNSFTNESVEWGIEALEIAIKNLDCKTAVHICYGYGIDENLRWKDSLGNQWNEYKTLFPALNNSNIDQVSVEFAGSKVPAELMRLLPNKEIMVGVITVVADHIETPEEVKLNIVEALKHVSKDQFIACSNCGMAPLPMETAKLKIKALGEGTKMANTVLF